MAANLAIFIHSSGRRRKCEVQPLAGEKCPPVGQPHGTTSCTKQETVEGVRRNCAELVGFSFSGAVILARHYDTTRQPASVLEVFIGR